MGMLNFNREIPVREEVDIFVAGGGPAGISAAVCAARQGRKVFLAEMHTCLGGMGTAGLVPAFMPFSDGVNFTADGIGREVLDKLLAEGGTDPEWWNGIRAEVLKRVYDRMAAEAGVKYTFMTQLIGIEKDGESVTFAILAGVKDIFAVKAKVFIDCTGNGDLSAFAGAPFEKGDENGNLMPGTLCSTWSGVDWKRAKEEGYDGLQGRHLEEAFKEKMFSVEDRHFSGTWRVGKNLGGANIGHTFGVDGTDEESITRALVDGRKVMPEFERYYKKYIKGFENVELVTTGSLLGLRETRRIIGDIKLEVQHFRDRASFEDEIGRYSYPVDIHASTPSKEDHAKFEKEFREMRYDKGENYGIPYRCLIPRELANVLVAGRCISTDRYMQSSTRVMPCCFITGQAAGIAASLAVENNTDTRGIDISVLQEKLKDIGAYLPLRSE